MDFPSACAFCGLGRFCGFFGGRFFVGKKVEVPKDCGEAEDQGHIGDIVDETIGHDLGRGTAFAAEDEGKNEIAEAGDIRSDERAEDGAFHAVVGHAFEAPNGEEGGGEEDARENPRGPDAGMLDPCDCRMHREELISGAGEIGRRNAILRAYV